MRPEGEPIWARIGQVYRDAEPARRRPWRLLLAEHNEAVRAEIGRFGGREAKTTGDGFFVLFDSPARAVRGAAAMIDAATAHGLSARAGSTQVRWNFRAMRCEGSRSMPQRAFSASRRRVKSWVSTTVRDLLSGSGLVFADRGEFELRGLDGRRSLAALVR